jgi:hypothetical protein
MKKKPLKSSGPLKGGANIGAADKSLRKHLIELLNAGHAHIDFEHAVGGLPAELRGVKPENLPFTAWGLLEHIRLAQWDIVEFSVNPKHQSPKWPEGYWPEGDAPPSDAAWKQSVQQCRKDLERMKSLVNDPHTDLYAAIPGGDGQTVLREAMLVADHNSYHLGQLVVLRRLLGAWKE